MKKEIIDIEPIEQQTLPTYWNNVFTKLPTEIIGDKEKLNKYITKFGVAFGKVKTEIIKHKLSGMNISAATLKDKLTKLEKDFDSKLYELLGFLLLDKEIKNHLEQKAKAVNKFFNEIGYKIYPNTIPSNVIDAINNAKQYFSESEIYVWSITDEPLIKDPVVIAKKLEPDNPNKDELGFVYYLIAIWGNDIELDDLINTKKILNIQKII